MAETEHDNLPFGVYFNVWSLYMIQFFFIKLLLINIKEQKKVEEEQF